MTGLSSLTPAARESAMHALLRQHPDAWVVAIDSRGLFVPMPDSVPLAGHRVMESNLSGLEVVVPADQQRVLEAWRRGREEGVAYAAVHLSTDPDRLLGVHVIDVRHRFGVVLGLFLGIPDDSARTTSDRSALVPRRAVIRKDEGSVITAVDEAVTAILGWTAAELVGRRTLDLVHPDDVDRAVANWMDMLSRPGGARRVRYRHRHRDGSWRWLEVTNHNHLIDAGEPHVTTDLVDVNEEVVAHEALRASEQLLRRLTEALPVAVLHISVDRAVTYRNDRLGHITGVVDAATVADQFAFLMPTDRPAVLEAVDAVLNHSRDADVEASFHPPATSMRRCVMSLRALTGDNGRVTGAIVCLVDITEDVKLREELEQRVRNDPLTGCLNHASVLVELRHRLAKPDDGSCNVVAFIDLDEFKEINDQYGHIAGDRVLEHVATRLRSVAGEDGLVGRLGGDEFLVILRTPDTPEAPSLAADQVACALNSPLLLGPEWIVPRASIGISYSSATDREPDALVAVADEAMYESKRLGRGTPIIVHPGQT